jgi:hypothetical protein
MISAHRAIRVEIDRREREVASLRQALAALIGVNDKVATKRVAKRRPKTAAEKKRLSAKLRAAWKRREAEQQKGA